MLHYYLIYYYIIEKVITELLKSLKLKYNSVVISI